MFPYRDENPTSITPYVTILLILANALSWVFVQGLGFDAASMAHSLCDLSLIPGELTGLARGMRFGVTPGFECVVDAQPSWYTLITMQFLHGGWLHLIGNMLFLWVFGNNIEDALGHTRFILFYLMCGVLAAVTHIAMGPSSAVPTVGASGAISGVLGAYLVLYPTARVWMALPIFIFIYRFALPAWVFLIYWIGIQFLSGMADRPGGGGVAFWAHVGGFVAGFILILFFKRRRPGKPRWVRRANY